MAIQHRTITKPGAVAGRAILALSILVSAFALPALGATTAHSASGQVPQPAPAPSHAVVEASGR